MQANFKKEMYLDREKTIEFGKDPDSILRKLEGLEDVLSNRILNTLNKEKDRNNFISTISEIKFINELNDLNFNIEYEKKYKIGKSEKTPDLTLEIKGENSILEVYRLGSSYKDNLEDHFINRIWAIVSETESNKLLSLRFKNKYFYLNDFDSKNLKRQIQEFLNKKPKLNSVFKFNLDIEFMVLGEGTNCKTQISTEPLTLNIKSEKLTQVEGLSENEITKKIEKYKELVEKRKIPYFLGIETDFISGFHFTDFKERFQYKNAGFENYQKYERIILEQGYGQEWSILGDFYKYPHLSGLIISLNNEFRILLSPLRNQTIFKETYKNTLNLLCSKFASI